jgi:hypothetical protein
VKHSGLEVAATYNFLLPRVDLVGGYRWRGFGGNDPKIANPNKQFDNVLSNLASGDFQEFYLGAEAALPVGFRQAHSALQNAKLKQSRQNAILDEVKRQIVHDLSNAFASVDRAYKQTQVNFNRLTAANERSQAIQSKPGDKPSDIDLLLDAERRKAEAEVEFFRSIVSYVISIKNVHLEKGSLLPYNHVFLSDFGVSSDPSLGKAANLEFASATRPTDNAVNSIIGSQATSSEPEELKTSTQVSPTVDATVPQEQEPPRPKVKNSSQPAGEIENGFAPVFPSLTNPQGQ